MALSQEPQGETLAEAEGTGWGKGDPDLSLQGAEPWGLQGKGDPSLK